MRLFKYLSRNIHAVLRQKQKKAVDFSTAFFGAGEGTRIRNLNQTNPLSIGIYHYPCAISCAVCNRDNLHISAYDLGRRRPHVCHIGHLPFSYNFIKKKDGILQMHSVFFSAATRSILLLCRLFKKVL